MKPLSETARELGEARRILEGVETTALSGVAVVLAGAAESLAQTAERLEKDRPAQWMTPEQAAAYLGCTSVAAFERVVSKEGIPKHYLSERLPRYNRAELDVWLIRR